MKKCFMALCLVAFTACGWEGNPQTQQTAPDASVVDNTAAPDNNMPDLGASDLGVDTTVDDSVDASTDVEVTPDVPEVCVPDCKGKACGDNGCGGECAPCPQVPCKVLPTCVDNTCMYLGVVCDDHDPCMVGTCAAQFNACMYLNVVCDDHDPCTIDSCSSVRGGCVHSPKDCDDGDACTADSCDPATGACVHTGKVCDDGKDYTADTCDPATGACVFTVVAGACTKDTDCEDGNPCTKDVCDGVTHQCKNVEILCNDDNPCTVDKCLPPPVGVLGWVCDYEQVSCDDGDACTADSCDPNKGCQHQAIAGCCKADADCADFEYCGEGSCWNLGCAKSGECWGWVAKNHQCQKWLATKGTPCDAQDTPKSACDGAGLCVPVPECTTNADCNDNNTFTDDVCDKTNNAWECKHFQKEFAFWCSVPVEWQATGRYCEIWVGIGELDSIGNPTQDVFLLKENGEKLSADLVCHSWWKPWKVEVNVRVFGSGIDPNTAPWVSGSYAKMADPAGNNIPLVATSHGWPSTPNWGVTSLPWCK